jgi:hypothetical protein
MKENNFAVESAEVNIRRRRKGIESLRTDKN